MNPRHIRYEDGYAIIPPGISPKEVWEISPNITKAKISTKTSQVALTALPPHVTMVKISNPQLHKWLELPKHVTTVEITEKVNLKHIKRLPTHVREAILTFKLPYPPVPMKNEVEIIRALPEHISIINQQDFPKTHPDIIAAIEERQLTHTESKKRSREEDSAQIAPSAKRARIEEPRPKPIIVDQRRLEPEGGEIVEAIVVETLPTTPSSTGLPHIPDFHTYFRQGLRSLFAGNHGSDRHDPKLFSRPPEESSAPFRGSSVRSPQLVPPTLGASLEEQVTTLKGIVFRLQQENASLRAENRELKSQASKPHSGL